MPEPDHVPISTFRSHRYSADGGCEHCGGIIRHERWCITRDPIVYYAYQIVADPGKLTPGDELILHSLGVIWGANVCQAKSKTKPKANAI